MCSNRGSKLKSSTWTASSNKTQKSFKKRFQDSKDTKNPQRKLIYNTIVSMLKQKVNGEPITIKQIADKSGITRNTVYRIKNELESFN